MAVLGIDVGTSGAKAVVLNEEGQPLGGGQATYEIDRPRPGWAEQAPETWRAAVAAATGQALAEANGPVIAAIGLSGQMHGVVTLDAAFAPLGSAIIWADERAAVEARAIEARLGQARLIDLAGTGLGAVAAPAWSPDLLAAAGVPPAGLPPMLPSAAVAGRLRAEAAAALQLPPGALVVTGCADTAGMALAAGAIEPGDGLVAVSTGGQALAALDRPAVDRRGRLHTFHHAVPDRWYLLGATLAAGLALRWAGRMLLGATDFAALMALAAQAPPGAHGLLFQPNLLGERAPGLNPAARGALTGLRLDHDRPHIARAVLEGVAFSLRAALDAVAEVTGRPERLVVAGGGLRFPLWRQVMADALGQPLWTAGERDLAATGAARLAGVTADHWASPAAPWPAAAPAVQPGPGAAPLADAYARFRALSPGPRA